jgi:DNA recombination protein RmuC
MNPTVALALALAAVTVAAVAVVLLVTRPNSTPDDPGAAALREAVAEAVAALRADASFERDQAIQAALQQAAVVHGEQLGHGLQAGRRELDVKKELIDTRLDQVREEVRGELQRLGQLVQQLGQRNNDQLVQVEATLRAQTEITAALASSTQSLREALANPKARGQWGERMAEDVLRLAGFIEHVNYEKQTAVDGARGLPDFTFKLPKGHVLYMDVKFPLAAYLRYLEAGTDAERAAHRDTFVRDVRLRVKELAERDYPRVGAGQAVDYVLLFLPNETISGFVHEHDPALVEHALTQKVVLCSPLTLFAFLGVIRQAFDNFMIEQTSDEILALLGSFATQWGKFTTSMDRVKSRLDSVQREFEQLSGPRRRQLERPLAQIDALRHERGIAIAEGLVDDTVLEFEGYRDERGA